MRCVQVQVTGQYPNNTANILNATTICNSQVYIVDKVLLPANSTQFIPSPGNGLVIANNSASSNSSAALFPGLRFVSHLHLQSDESPGSSFSGNFKHSHCTCLAPPS